MLVMQAGKGRPLSKPWSNCNGSSLSNYMGDPSLLLLQYLREECYKQSENCDVVLQVDKKRLHCHRLILLRCPFFEALLSRRWSNADDVNTNDTQLPVYDIELPECTSFKAFQWVMDYLYGLDTVQSSDVATLHETYLVAKYLGIDSLSQECHDRLEKLIVPENISLLCQTFLHRQNVPESEHIQSMVMHLLCRNGPQVAPKVLFEEMHPDQLDSIWRSDTFYAKSDSARLSSLLELYSLAVDKSDPEWIRTIQALLRETVYYEHVPASQLNNIVHKERELKISGLSVLVKHGFWSKSLLRSFVSKCPRQSPSCLGIVQDNCSGDEEQNFIENSEEPRYALDKITSPFAPFRFSCEFHKFNLSPSKRVYSDLYFYAGSVWRVYLLQDEHLRVGVYLMRSRRDIHPSLAYTFSIISEHSSDGNINALSEKHIYKRRDWLFSSDYEEEDAVRYLGSRHDRRKLEYVTSLGQTVGAQPQTPINSSSIIGAESKSAELSSGADLPDMQALMLGAFDPCIQSQHEWEDSYDDVRQNVTAHFTLVVSTEKDVHMCSDARTFSVDQSFGLPLPDEFSTHANCIKCNVSILLA